MGVSDKDGEAPWLKDEIELIKLCVSRKIGLIGVCLGAQLLAFSEGGAVTPLKNDLNNNDIAEIGWSKIYPVSSKQKNSFIKAIDKPLNVLHWHKDRIILPDSADLLASSNLCKEQFFSIGTKACGLQFHLELESKEDFITWLNEDREFIEAGIGNSGYNDLMTQFNKIHLPNKENMIRVIKLIFEILAS